jgi:orotidine-5'-phosphate decarboxylase
VTTVPFGERLRAATTARGPLCVGIDPHPGLLAAWGLPDDASGLERFALGTVEALADRVAVLKPQSAFFERHGSRGIAVLERVVVAARAAGALVVLDAKRGDIGSTMTAYAQAYLDPASPLAVDALTVSPYLGYGSLRPAIDLAHANGCGLFVLALTSNPEAAALQHLGGSLGSVAARRSAPPSTTSGSTSPPARPRSWRPGWGRRVAAQPSSLRSSAAPGPTCCRPPRARCSAPDPRWPACARPPSAPWTSSARRSADPRAGPSLPSGPATR